MKQRYDVESSSTAKTKCTEKRRKASDGLEHGFGAFDQIHAASVKHRDQLGVLVRHAIFELAKASESCQKELLNDPWDTAVAASRVSKFLRCTLNGDPNDFALEDQAYPYFELHSGIKSVSTAPDGSVTMEPTEEAVRFVGPNIEITDARFEVWGPPGIDIRRPRE